MELKIGIAKIAKANAMESCETVELIERPIGGGYSIVLSDGSFNNIPDKKISNFCAKKIGDMIFDGVRDSVALRATSDSLYSLYNGKACGSVNILSLDLVTDTLVISRNNPYPVYYYRHGDFIEWSKDSYPIGTAKHVEPSLTEMPIQPGATIIAATDGVFKSGGDEAGDIDIPLLLDSIMEENIIPSAQAIAEMILQQAVERDNNYPQNDMTVVIFQVTEKQPANAIRKIHYQLPF